MRTKIAQLQQDDIQPKAKVVQTWSERKAGDTPYMFDCYITRENTTNDGPPVNFDGCGVDTTTVDPWKGTFVVPAPGVWRFTFHAGLVYIPFDWWQAFFFLWVDDIISVALTNVSPIG